MLDQETLALLKKNETEVKKSITAIKNVLEPMKNPEFKLMVLQHKDALKAEDKAIEEKLKQEQDVASGSHKITEAVSKVIANAKLLAEKDDKHIAALLFDSCNDSLKELYSAFNANNLADDPVKAKATNIIQILITLREDLITYL